MKFLMLLTLTLLLSFGLGLSQHALGAEPNKDDVTLQRDNERIMNSDPAALEGQAVVPGNDVCTTCHKTTTGGTLDTTPKIEPQGERPAKAEPTKGNRVND